MEEVYTTPGTRTTVYRIRDAEGRHVADHVRKDRGPGDKDCFWRLADAGSKEWGLRGMVLEDLPLYGSEQVSDWPEDDLIVFVEGEKACAALDQTDFFPAVGSVCGASKTPGSEALKVLRRRRVVIWPDNDEAGRKHAEAVAEALHGIAAEVLIFDWPDAPDKGDAADHPAVLSGDRRRYDRLLTELESAPRWKPSPLRKTITAARLLAEDLPPVKWAVPTMVPEGVTILAGKPKLGKSWLALGLCVSIAAGGYALDAKPVEGGSALYLGLEDNRRRLRGRLQKTLGGRPAPEGLEVATEWPRMDEGGLEALDAWLNEHPDPRLIVIDTLARFKPRANGRRNAYDEDRDAVDPLAPLVAKHSVAILLVHHLRKLAAADPLDEINSSTGLIAGVDGALILKRDRGRADAYLHVTGREIEEEAELALRWDQDLASWTLAGDADEYRQSEERRRIIALLKRADEPMQPKDIAESLGKNRATVRRLLQEMKLAGQIADTGNGYTPTHEHRERHEQSQQMNGRPPVHVVHGVQPVHSVHAVHADAPILTVEQVGSELRRNYQGGPAKALKTYLDDPKPERLMWLTNAVLVVRFPDVDTSGDAWKGYVDVVKEAAGDPANHPPFCECEGCL